MQKGFLIILAFIYLGVSGGISVDVHYCMGKLAYIDFKSQKDKCTKCGMKTNTGSCCKHELKIVKIDDSHKLVSNEISIFSSFAALPDHPNFFTTELYNSIPPAEFKNNSPPWTPGTSLCILHCVFRV